MTRPYPDLGSGSDSSCQEGLTCLCVERCSLSPFFLCQGEGAATRGLEGNKLLFLRCECKLAEISTLEKSEIIIIITFGFCVIQRIMLISEVRRTTHPQSV